MDSPIDAPDDKTLKLTTFSDEDHDSTFHFQILRLTDQLYVWIGCNSARMGNIYAALPSPFERAPSLAALLGGGADRTGAGIARRLSMRTGWSIVLASNLPSNSPTIEAFAEQRLFQELRSLGYVKPTSKPLNVARVPPTE